jgi:hypothetical protein
MLNRIRAAVIVVLAVGLCVAGFTGYRLFTEEPEHHPPVSEVTDTTDDGWQVVSYRGVSVELPPEWDRLDTAGCDEPGTSGVERWGPAAVDPCAGDLGLWFLAAATFDPASGPGVHTTPVSGNLPAGGWGGYVTRDDVVVNVAGDDQDAVRRILQSVSQQI